MKWRLAMAAFFLVAGLLGNNALRRVDVPQYVDIEPQLATGAFHVHSRASHDCWTSPTTLAAAAQAAQVDFIVLTDHNVQAEAAAAQGGVCLLSFAELSTPGGHLIAMGASHSATRTLRRRLDVTQAAADMGAMPIVAHPTDSKRPWTGGWHGVGGLEIANVASAARRVGGLGLLGLVPLAGAALAAPRLALLQLMGRDDSSIALWDAHPRQQLVGFCGLDAHGWIASAHALNMWQMAFFDPAASTWRGTCAAHHQAALAMQQGQFYCFNALLGARPRFVFVARQADGRRHSATAQLLQSEVEALEIAAPRLNVGNVEIVVWRDGQVVLRSYDTHAEVMAPLPGTYRVELWATLPSLTGAAWRSPIVYSNRITLLGA